ncbi:MAG TPA: hypothetical protein VIG30_00885, partial [Ktedonobacterales bacterium]
MGVVRGRQAGKAAPADTGARDATLPRLRGAERVVAWLLPSLGDLIFAACLLGIIFVLQGRALGVDGDIGWHIALGLRTLGGDLPRADTFSFTAYGRPLVGVEWLAEAAYAAVWRVAGLNGVVALAALLIAVTAAGLLAAVRARGVPLLLALPLALVAIALTSIAWEARPHLFSFALTLWWSEWLWRYWRDGRRWRLWCFPAVMALWVNLHGGFLAGLILLGTAVAVAWLFPRAHGRAEPRALALTWLACVVATFANPWGATWIGYYAAFFSDPLVAAHTQEWQSPDFHTLAGRLFLALLLLLVAAWIFGGRGAGRAEDGAAMRGTASSAGAPEPLAWATAGVWTVLALTAIRAVPLWALIVTPLLGQALAGWLVPWFAGRATGETRAAKTAPKGVPPRRPPARPRRMGYDSRAARLGHGLRGAGARVAGGAARLEAVERQIGRGVWSGVALLLVLVVVFNGGKLPGGRAPVVDVRFSATAFPVAAVARLRAEGLPP